jgi:hypothetical protein
MYVRDIYFNAGVTRMAMPTTEILEHIGAVMGILGAVLLASNTRLSRYGWLGFMVSSLALTGFAYLIEAWSLLAMQSCFVATNGFGLWRWLVGPSLLRRRSLAMADHPAVAAQ